MSVRMQLDRTLCTKRLDRVQVWRFTMQAVHCALRTTSQHQLYGQHDELIDPALIRQDTGARGQLNLASGFAWEECAANMRRWKLLDMPESSIVEAEAAVDLSSISVSVAC
jgi:hypothetical protein